MTLEENIRALLFERKAKIAMCPARLRSLGDALCPRCQATTKGPCWLNVEADAAFVDAIKELAA